MPNNEFRSGSVPVRFCAVTDLGSRRPAATSSCLGTAGGGNGLRLKAGRNITQYGSGGDGFKMGEGREEGKEHV